MVQTKEERAAKQKVYDAGRKEEKAILWKAWNEKNKVERAAYKKLQREKKKVEIAAYKKWYNKTPQGKRTEKLSKWKRTGTIGDLKGFYDDRYLPAVKCEVCKNKFKNISDKNMDHDHITGEIRFVLCRSCNCHDYWKKHVAANRIIKLFKIL